MNEWEWNSLVYWCRVRAAVTGQRQRIYACRIGGQWKYWSTAASAGYSDSDGSMVRREMVPHGD